MQRLAQDAALPAAATCSTLQLLSPASHSARQAIACTALPQGHAGTEACTAHVSCAMPTPSALLPPAAGRSSERPVLSEDEIEHNVSCIRDTLTSILQRNSAAASGAPSPVVLNNLDWFGPMSFLGFLREVGEAQGQAGRGRGSAAGHLAACAVPCLLLLTQRLMLHVACMS